MWDGIAMSIPPSALVLLEKHEDPGDLTRPYSTPSLFVETLEAAPRRFWRNVSEVCSFDQQLPLIYRERRQLLEHHGMWEQTVEVVRRAMLQRLLEAKQLSMGPAKQVSMGELWARRLAMGEEPCPVTDREADEWSLARSQTQSASDG